MFSYATTCDMFLGLSEVLDEFKDVSPDDLSTKLPPLRDIQHAMDLISGLPLANLTYYRINPSECEALNRQIKGLLQKDFIQHSLSPYVVPALLTLRIMALRGCVLTVKPLIRLL